MRLPKILRWIVYVVGGLIAVLVVILAVLALVQIPIDLTKHKGAVESLASRTLDRPLRIDGKIQVTTSLWPAFEIEGVRLGNPEGFQEGDFSKMKTAKVQVAVLPLLLTKVHILEFSVKGVSVDLVANKEGAVNWSSRKGKDSTPKTPKEERPKAERGELKFASDSLVIKKLTLEDVSVSYREPSMTDPLEFKVEECTGAALAGKPFALSMKGTLLKQPFTTEIKAASLEELLKESRSWMNVKMEIAKTHFEVEGKINLSQAHQTLNIKSSVRGKSLDSLNELLNVSLPPLKAYGAGGILSMREKRIDLSDFEIHVGKSKLTGKMTIDNKGSRPVASIDLAAPMIQLNDFDVGDWSVEGGKPEETAKEKAEPAASLRESGGKPKATAERAEAVANLFSPEVLGNFDAQMKVKVKKVLSGADELGSGLMTATLKEGRLSIDPVKLNIPGGSFLFAMSVKPGRAASEASVRALIDKFDFGVIARRADPETKMGGTISLDVDLKSSAKKLEELLANGNGYFDFAGSPENLSSGIIDLWAVNLIAAIASRGDENGASKINCVIGRLSMKEGLLYPEAFLIDTSKIRICGKGEVDFKKQAIVLKVAPTPKRPEFFNLATPLEVRGKFSDFGVGIQPGGLFGTAISFVTSPLHVPFRRLAGEGLPEDGGDVCGMSIGSEARPIKPPAGCR